MKEIKFRAWDTEKNIFVPQWEIIFSDYWDTKVEVVPNCIEYIWDDVHNWEPQRGRFHVMQYTWIKDRNWKEIYEGDILQYKENRNYWKVEFIEWCFKILRNFSDPHKETFIVWWYHEIIWNIYEDKHLLTN